MGKEIIGKENKKSMSLAWLLQLVASLSWMVSMIVYGSYALGDCLQLLAASAWTVSNIMTYFNERRLPVPVKGSVANAEE